MDTPTLDEMGIRNASSIVRYKLKHKVPGKDQLDIYYKRKKGSLLPVKRTYEFGRSKSTDIVDSSTAKIEDAYDISPLLLSAVDELNHLLKHEDAEVDQQELMLVELESMKRLIKAGETHEVVREKLQALINTL